MLINRNEMIEEFERQIRKFGGAWSEWCVGTAKDARGLQLDHDAAQEAERHSALQQVAAHGRRYGITTPSLARHPS